jgi:hypothetical protein
MIINDQKVLQKINDYTLEINILIKDPTQGEYELIVKNVLDEKIIYKRNLKIDFELIYFKVFV